MIMADQDHDGSHIKGLVINFLHHFWPSLLALPGFLREFITPIVKAVKGKTATSFFTLPEYIAWKTATAAGSSVGTKGWAIKYYKGLGTSTSVGACGARQLRGAQPSVIERQHQHQHQQPERVLSAACNHRPALHRASVHVSLCAAEAKEYFAAIDKHQLDFEMDDPTVTGANASECRSIC